MDRGRSPYPALAAVLIAALWPALAGAVLRIEITQGLEGALPIAVVPFAVEGAGAAPPHDVAAIVAADLARSGKFRPLPASDMPQRPSYVRDVSFDPWRAMGMESLVVGRVRQEAPGRYEIQFQLLDVVRKQQIVGYSLPATSATLRSAAHEIADIVFERITGIPGAFNTRIAYVSAQGQGEERRYVLQVADADGYDANTVLQSDEPLMSPTWSPDGRSLAYVSFESGRPEIFVQELATAQRDKLASFPGINGAPRWSPDGRRMAMTLSRDGNPEIYVMELGSRRLQRITDNRAIDTEPAWTPDGERLIFTSDRSGAPQLYEVPARGGRAARLTFEGRYNARAAVSPDGKAVAMVHGDAGGGFRIAVLDRETRALRVLTDGRLDESPTFAPNGSMILYASTDGRRGLLYAVSVDGRVRQRLTLTEGGDVREPAWSPLRADRRRILE